jgi:tetratricopeptide (TPR) repeat protein
MLIKQWSSLIYIIFCLSAACTVPVARPVAQQQYFVDGKPVSEEMYRAAGFYNDALPLLSANRLAEARIKLTAAVRLAPGFHDARYSLGAVLLQLEREQEALEHCKAIVAAKADLPMAWVSTGAIYLNGGLYDEALNICKDAISRFPDSTWRKIPDLHYICGTTLGQTGRIEEAIEKLQLAVRADVKLPVAWMNLGAFYQVSGQLEQSIYYYKEFMKRAPNDADVAVIADAVKVMEAELKEAAGIPIRSKEEYYAEVTKNQPKAWSRKSMPLRVHIRSGAGIPGFEPRFMDILKAAFDEWHRAAQGNLSIRFVDQPAEADIECLWSSDPAQLQNRAEGGEAQVYFREDGVILKVTIIILTVPLNRKNPVTDSIIGFVGLHEVGHALGLLGHSMDPRDIMFFAAPMTDQRPQLSDRDRKTLVRLYSQNVW